MIPTGNTISSKPLAQKAFEPRLVTLAGSVRVFRLLQLINVVSCMAVIPLGRVISVKLSQPSNVLILSFQRINERTQKKNVSEIKFSEKLSLKKYVDSDCGFYNESQYELFGIICHKGRISFGHYFTFIKIDERDWYEFND